MDRAAFWLFNFPFIIQPIKDGRMVMDHTILVIDDDEPSHVFTDHLFKDEYEVIHARNAQKGIDIISEKPINLLLRPFSPASQLFFDSSKI